MSTKLTVTVPNWLDRLFAWPVLLYRRQKYGFHFRRIPLERGRFTIVDPQDYYRLVDFKWYINGNGVRFYVFRNVITGPGRTRMLSMHRQIMNPPPNLLVDHHNGLTLDNRRANLRLATHCENACNRPKIKSKTSSQYIGVSFHIRDKRWCASIRHNKKRIWLGSFVSEIDAARAYDAASRKYHGEFARINFPNKISDVEIRNTNDVRRTTVAPAKSSRYNADRRLLATRSFQTIGCLRFARRPRVFRLFSA